MGKKDSRIRNSTYNFITSMGAQLISMVMNFVARSVFISTLGENYLGITELFRNILSMLLLAELGIGSAVLYRLYAPLAEDNKPKIQAWMHFYKNAYRVIGIVIAILGLCLIPFLPVIINGYEKFESIGINAVFIYCLFLFRSASSYLFFAYRSTLVIADQKEYILTVVGYAVTILTTVIEIICLLLWKNFIVYVVIGIIMVYVQNTTYLIISNKLYPYLKEKPKQKVSRQEIKETIKDCYAIFIYKVNGIVIKSTDNIVLSIFLGLTAVGLYSNYYILYSAIQSLSNKIFNSFVISIGNLHTTKNIEHEYLIFKVATLISIVFGATAGVGVYVVSDEFIATWLGARWVIPQPFSVLLGLEIFSLSISNSLGKFRNALGLFQQAKYRPLLSAVVNIVVSIIAVKFIGISGVGLGTIVTYWTTYLVFDPIVLFKHGFESKYPVKDFYLSLIGNLLVICFTGFGLKLLCGNFFASMGWLSVIAHAAICGVTIPLVILLVNWKRKETQYLVNVFKKKLLKRA